MSQRPTAEDRSAARESEPKRSPERKARYEPPEVLASYDSEELEAALRPQGESGGGCGCGGGSILI